jgi:hypothetical protein
MSHSLVQRNSINLCRPFLITLDFACQPYPQFVSESHDTMVLQCTLAILSSLVGHLEPSSRHFIIGSLTRWFPLCSTTRHLFTLWDLCSVLDAIILNGGFLTFVESFHHWLLFRVSFSCTACIWHTRKMHTGSLVHEHVLHPIYTKS